MHWDWCRRRWNSSSRLWGGAGGLFQQRGWPPHFHTTVRDFDRKFQGNWLAEIILPLGHLVPLTVYHLRSFSGGTQKSLLTVHHGPLLYRNYLGEYEFLLWQLHLSCLQNWELNWNVVMIGQGHLRYPHRTTVNCWVKVTKTSSSSSSIRPKHVLHSCATYLFSNITITIIYFTYSPVVLPFFHILWSNPQKT